MNLLLIFLCLFGMGFASPKASQVVVSQVVAPDMSELASQLLQNPIHNPDTYTRAFEILDSLKSAPSCHKYATKVLIGSCQSLDSDLSDVGLAEVRESFAVRMAMCELQVSKVKLPTQCEPFIMSSRHCPKKQSSGIFQKLRIVENNVEPCFATTDLHQLKSCVNALVERPQFWTSYSNAHQNVVTVCHASRGAAERGMCHNTFFLILTDVFLDEILKIFRDSAKMSEELTMMLADSLKRSLEFAAELEIIRQQSLQNWRNQASEVDSTLKSMMSDMLTGFGSMTNIMSDTSKAVTNLNSDIKGEYYP
jgi:hypothetical protein